MNDLAGSRCVPCEGGVPSLDRANAEAQLRALNSAWILAADNKSLSRSFAFRDFYRTMSFVNALAHIANTEDHHPDLGVGYGYCHVTFSTHAIGGLSENDFICAAKLDRL